MNGIFYAGKAETGIEILHNRYEILSPNGKGKIISDGGIKDFDDKHIIIVPPLMRRTLKTDCECVLLERAVLPVKSVTLLRDDGSIRQAILQAEKFFATDKPQREPVVAALGTLLAGYIAFFSGKSPHSPMTVLIMEDIEKNVSNPSYALDDFLKKMPLNYDYVRKLFKKETGQTPHEYLLFLKMELAKSLILSGVSNTYSNYSVSQVAEACGFSEPLYFSRVFKKYFGKSPSEYSKNNL